MRLSVEKLWSWWPAAKYWVVRRVGKRRFMLVSGGRRAYFGSKGRNLNSASAHLELLSQNITMDLGIEPLEI